jgi:hypothetical protein
MWYLYTMKLNEILSFSCKWMELKNIILSEVGQVRKAKNHVLPHMWIIDLKQILSDMGHTVRGECAWEE